MVLARLAACFSWLEQTAALQREISKLGKEILAVGVEHLDLQPDNTLLVSSETLPAAGSLSDRVRSR